MKGTWLIVCAIFIIGFWLRATDLGTGLTIDEGLWLVRAPNFIDAIIQHNWTNTYQAPHPGIITMWISGIFMRSIPALDFTTKLSIARMPIVLITSVSIIFIFYFVRLIFNTKIALLSAMLVALDPFLLAHSRLIHQDAMLATFMTMSLLALMAFLNYRKIWMMISGGIFAGLAILTKMPGLFLMLFIPSVIIASIQNKMDSIRYILLIFLIIILTFFLLWPAMWVDPIGTIEKMVHDPSCGLEVAVESPHGSGYFWGIISDGNYGPLFYPTCFLMMSTPITLVFSVLCVGIVTKRIWRGGLTSFDKNISILILYIILFMAQMALGLTAFPRYVLPIFPTVDILAGIGIYLSFEKYLCKKWIFCLLLVMVTIMQMSLLVPISPYFLSYSNPVVFGGPSHAPEMNLMGWGEGNDLAAKYLNEKPNASNLTVAAQYAGFDPYFKGTTKTFYQSQGKTGEQKAFNGSNYAVFYICAIQRNFDKDLWNVYKIKTPEKIIILNGMQYCWIYRTNQSNLEQQ